MAAASTTDGGSGGLYGISGASWSSPSWNWGSAAGTGHDAAMICRDKFSSPVRRQEYLGVLLNGGSGESSSLDLEEAKLVLGLTVQRGRWDGTAGAYGEVMEKMASLRYEGGSQGEEKLIEDLIGRYGSVGGSVPQILAVAEADGDGGSALRVVGLVLKKMQFVETGC
eukprot:CAMPEP_0194307750 /NCGR_PEP_ID=MMETSP0171-20130528/4655_1 /TAXON_ID=218684 /ORGANISM="Corethron pennatum, Strain L29A3" /LENGTH=167 /DNA_ID=CAMNT_0039059987 /DNA_START=153 /DNA_END=656 /DNA_ORIENTATION=-